MSVTKKIEEITPKQISDRGVQALADRPNAQARYGVGGLSAPQLKLWFDKLATFLAGKINEITKAISGEEAAFYVKLALEEANISNLGDLIEAFKNGAFASKVVKIFPTARSDTGYSLTKILDMVLLNEANGLKSVIYDSTNSSIVIERNGGGQISVSLKLIIDAITACETGIDNIISGTQEVGKATQAEKDGDGRVISKSYVLMADFNDIVNGETSVGHAKRASSDASGNNIELTYATNIGLNNLKTFLQNAIAEAVSAIYRPIGTRDKFPENSEIGDCFNSSVELELNGRKYPAGTNFVYVRPDAESDPVWDALAGFVDLSPITAQIAEISGELIHNIVDGTGECSVQQASTEKALPDRNRATGPYAAAFGDGTSAIEDGAFSTGIRTRAKHRGSFSAGNGTVTTRKYQMVIGTHNDTSVTDALFMVGNSESAFAPSNAFVVKEDGQATVGALPQEPMAVATKSITDGLDERVSYLESFNLEYIVNSTDNGVLSIPSNQYLGKKAFLNTVGGKSLIWNGYEGVYDPYDSSKNFDIDLGDIELPAGSYTIRDCKSGADLQKLLTCIVKYVPKDTPDAGEQTLDVSGMSTITVPFDIILKSMWCNSLSVATISPYFVNLSTGDVLFIPGSWLGFKPNKPEEIRVYSTANKYSSIHIPDGDGFGYGYDNIVNSIDFDTQTYTKRCDIVTVDGSESYWNWNGSYTNGYAFIYTHISNVAPEMALDDESLPISDLFGSVISYNEAVASNAIMCKTDESVVGFWILKYDLWELSPSEDTLEGFREWLNRRPVSILFALKTPVVRDISDEGLNGLIDVTAGGRIEVVSESGIAGTLQATFVVPRE